MELLPPHIALSAVVLPPRADRHLSGQPACSHHSCQPAVLSESLAAPTPSPGRRYTDGTDGSPPSWLPWAAADQAADRVASAPTAAAAPCCGAAHADGQSIAATCAVQPPQPPPPLCCAVSQSGMTAALPPHACVEMLLPRQARCAAGADRLAEGGQHVHPPCPAVKGHRVHACVWLCVRA